MPDKTPVAWCELPTKTGASRGQAPAQAAPGYPITRFNPATGSTETALQMAAVIALRDEQAAPKTEALEQAARLALETLERASDSGFSVECDESIAALRKALGQVTSEAPQQEAQEPVAWQSRTRPTWGANTSLWSPWEPCTKGQAEDYWKTPLLHDWAYEARALYTAPQAAPAAQGDAEDAARYRWLIDYLISDRYYLDDAIIACDSKQELDDVIDAARAKDKEGGA